jgi:hypothetical protein
MKRITLLLLIFSLLCFSLTAQTHKVLYQQLSIGDSVTQIELQVKDSCEVTSWSGHNILIETHLEYREAPLELIVADIKSGYYDIVTTEQNRVFNLKSKPQVKSKNNTTGKDVVVNIVYKIYIPEEFKIISKTQMSRPTDIVLANEIK